MKKKKLLLVGANGRMGREIRKALRRSKLFTKSVAVASHKVQDFEKTVKSLENIKRKEIDLILDFSLPEMALKSLQFAQSEGVPWVSGVTGFSATQKKFIKKCGKKTKVFWAPNMSLGVVALGAALKNFGLLPDIRIDIVETHHTKKKDRPSGTALFLKEKLESAGKKVRSVRSIRKGKFVGKHEIRMSSPEEEIYIQHNALKRAVFAKGAVFACDWLLKQKKNGYYTFENVLEDI